jgi:hypothetical protein
VVAAAIHRVAGDAQLATGLVAAGHGRIEALAASTVRTRFLDVLGRLDGRQRVPAVPSTGRTA